MCSLYPRDERTLCACFLGKDESIADEMAAERAEALLWAAGGSGVVSLADLEAELSGKRSWDPDAPSDAAFLAQCKARGISLFGVVFRAQGYEVELVEGAARVAPFADEGGERRTWGLSASYRGELSQHYSPARSYYSQEQWAALSALMPGGDFIEAAACRDLRGERSLCHWVSSTGRAGDLRYRNYYMCANSPLWTAHLKKIIEMQIDAGLDGVHFDEPAIAIEAAATRSGFCANCQKSFREYLSKKYGASLEAFDFAAEARRRGAGFASELVYFRGTPHWRDFKSWLLESTLERHRELIAHTRACAERAGRSVLTSANYFNLFPHHLALAQHTDVVAYEFTPALPPSHGSVLYHQLARLVAGERPATGVPDIAFATLFRERARAGRDENLLRYFIAEAELAGGSFMVPYSCLSFSGEGAYFPPAAPVAEYRDFIKEHGEASLPEATPLADLQLILSFPSYFWSFDFLAVPGAHFRALADAARDFRESALAYELVLWGDGRLVEDRGALSMEKPVVVPRALYLSQERWERLLDFTRGGGRVALIGACGRYDEDGNEREQPLCEPFPQGATRLGEGILYKLPSSAAADKTLAAQLQQALGFSPRVALEGTGGRPAPLLSARKSNEKLLFGLLGRDYESATDRFRPAAGLSMIWRGAERPRRWRFHAPGRESVDLNITETKDGLRMALPQWSLYAVVEGNS